MIRLFSQPESFRTRGHNKALSGNYLEQIAYNCISAKQYYNRTGMSVRGNHILATLINSLHVPFTLPPERFAEHVEVACMAQARILGIGTAVTEPELNKTGFFYGLPEIILGTIEAPLEGTWNPTPVKVVMHPRTDTTYTLLDGQRNTDEEGLVVISIDMVSLMLHYRRWILHEQRVNPDNPRGAVHFVKTKILPSMIESHNAIAFVNRMKNGLLGLAPADQIKRTPFSLPLTMSLEKRYMEYLITRFTKTKPTYEELLSDTRVTINDDLREFTEMPAVPPTRYGKLMMLLTALPTIQYLILFSRANANGNNSNNAKHEIELLRFLKRYETERWVSNKHISRLIDRILADDVLALL